MWALTPKGKRYLNRLLRSIDTTKDESDLLRNLYEVDNTGQLDLDAQLLKKKNLIVEVPYRKDLVFYHVSPAYNKEDILRRGLDPTKEGTTTGGGLVQEEGPSSRGRLYLQNKIPLSSIDNLIADLNPELGSKWSIFKVEIPKGVKLNRDPYYISAPGTSYYVEEYIPPENIRFIKNRRAED